MEMNLIINKHVRGIALPMALGFSILFMLLTLTMFDLIRLSANQSNEIREKAKIQKQIEFVKDRILDDTRSDSTWLNRYYVFNKRDTIHAVSWPWGGFTCITLTPDGNASDLKSSFLLCHERNDNAGIIYGDEDLRISGKVKIQGKVQVKGSVIRSRIEQEIFSGNVVNAWFHEHMKELPYEAGFTVYTPEAESIPYRKHMQLKNSFGNETKRIWSETNASLASCMFSGNIIIQSENDLIIDSTSYLEDVILRARRIKIENGFKGSVQCYATEGISIGANCHLIFPSGIYASGDFIKVGDNSTVNGIIVFSRFIKNGYESIINSANY